MDNPMGGREGTVFQARKAANDQYTDPVGLKGEAYREKGINQ